MPQPTYPSCPAPLSHRHEGHRKVPRHHLKQLLCRVVQHCSADSVATRQHRHETAEHLECQQQTARVPLAVHCSNDFRNQRRPMAREGEGGGRGGGRRGDGGCYVLIRLLLRQNQSTKKGRGEEGESGDGSAPYDPTTTVSILLFWAPPDLGAQRTSAVASAIAAASLSSRHSSRRITSCKQRE